MMAPALCNGMILGTTATHFNPPQHVPTVLAVIVYPAAPGCTAEEAKGMTGS
jgi:hypothetical protein